MPEPIKPEGQKPYTVLKIDELSRMSDTQGIERYYRYRIKTKGGTILSKDIDEKDTEPEKADKILTALAEKFDKLLAQ